MFFTRATYLCDKSIGVDNCDYKDFESCCTVSTREIPCRERRRESPSRSLLATTSVQQQVRTERQRPRRQTRAAARAARQADHVQYACPCWRQRKRTSPGHSTDACAGHPAAQVRWGTFPRVCNGGGRLLSVSLLLGKRTGGEGIEGGRLRGDRRRVESVSGLPRRWAAGTDLVQ